MTRHFRIYAWSILAFHLAVIFWGAYVRASGSGAGCGEHWPLCNGQIIPHGPLNATLIEFGHRLTSGIAFVSVLILAAAAFRIFPRGHRVRRWALLALGSMLIECAIGAALVLLNLVEANESVSRGLWLAAHLINTLFLLATLALSARGAGTVQNKTGNWESVRMHRLVRISVLGFLCTAILGGFAALGDTLAMSNSVAEGIRADFSPASSIFVRLRILHPIAAAALGMSLMWFALQVSNFERRLATTIAALVFFQFSLGIASILLRIPAWLQPLHLLGADLLWIECVLLISKLLPPTQSVLRSSIGIPRPCLRQSPS